MGKLLKTLVFDDQISVSVLDTTDIVNEAIKIHKLSPVAAAALGRTLTVCAFMSSGLKSDKDKLSVTVKGDGPLGKITVCGNGELCIRGSVDNPNVDLPLKENGKLNVGGAVGNNGRITVVKSMGLKEPYSGSCKLVTGEIAEDFTAYFAYSEQQPTAIAVGVKIGKDLTCVGAGGVIIQPLPDTSEENIEKAESIISQLKNVSTLIETGSAEEVLKRFFGNVKYQEYNPVYKCLCNKENVENTLISLGEKELRDIIKEQGNIKVTCQFCDKEYIFTEADVDKMF